MMYKLLIVDDEQLSRYSFRTFIERIYRDIEIVGEAENANQAIELCRKSLPDIIVMDIRMPGMNGIDASKIILEEFPHMNILVLTAYDNFSYIQQAINIGVKGYLLKPINKNEATEKFNKILQEISENQKDIELRKKIERKVNVAVPLIQKELISVFTDGVFDTDEINSYLYFLQEKIEGGYFFLVSFKAAELNHINDSLRNRIMLGKIQDALERYMPELKKCMFGYPIGNMVVVLIPLIGVEDPQSDLVKESLALADGIKRKIKVVTNIDIAIGIGGSTNDIGMLNGSFSEALFALRSAMGDCSIKHFSQIDNRDQHHLRYPIHVENNLFEQLRLGNIQEAKNICMDFISIVFSDHVELHILREYIGQLITLMKRILQQIGIEMADVVHVGQLTELIRLNSVDDLKRWSVNNLFTLMDLAENASSVKERISKIKIYEYVSKNIVKNVTLESTADAVGLSPQYLSKFFKANFGMNFIEYITDKRMMSAKEFLKSDKYSVKEISEMVGYTDPNYFCRLFKKVTGLTPGEYKKQLK